MLENLEYTHLNNPFYKNPQNLMPDSNPTIIQTEPLSSQNQVDTTRLQQIKENPPKAKSIIDCIKSKKGLYAKLKRAYLSQVALDIENGKKTSQDIERFVYSLIEKGLN